MQSAKTRNTAISFPLDLDEKSVNDFYVRLNKCDITEFGVVALDCSELEEVTSSHIGIMFQVWEFCNRNKMKTSLRNITPSLAHVLQVLDLEELFIIEDVSGRADRRPEDCTENTGIHIVFERNFCAKIEDIKAIMQEFEEYLFGSKLPRSIAFDLKTIFYEVAYNIYDHSGLKETDEIKFVAGIKNNEIIMEFEDDGRSFDPTSRVSDRNLEDVIDGQKIRGFGLMMINRLVDSISYEYRDNHTNVLKLEKKWRPCDERLDDH